MNMIKYCIIFILIFFSTTLPLWAQSIQIRDPIRQTSVESVVFSVLDFLVQLGAIALVLAIVYAGFLFVAAQGNPEKLKTARSALFWTIIGGMILLGARMIANVVENTIRQL